MIITSEILVRVNSSIMILNKLDNSWDNTIRILARVKRKEIGYINCIIDGYEGIGLVRTRDRLAGIIEFWILPEYIDIFNRVIKDLNEETQINLISMEEKDINGEET